MFFIFSCHIWGVRASRILQVVFYSNITDLSKKIQLLLDNDKLRINIAKAGYNKYHKYMNSNLVTEYMINKTFKINSKKKYIWEF